MLIMEARMQPYLLWGGHRQLWGGKAPVCGYVQTCVCISGVRMLACECLCVQLHRRSRWGLGSFAWQVAASLRDLGEAERGEVPADRAVGMRTAALISLRGRRGDVRSPGGGGLLEVSFLPGRRG